MSMDAGICATTVTGMVALIEHVARTTAGAATSEAVRPVRNEWRLVIISQILDDRTKDRRTATGNANLGGDKRR